MNPSVLMVVGLPGCGKTTYLEELRQDGWSAFDDFKAGAVDDSSMFCKSRSFAALLSSLREGGRCAVADIDFCRSAARTEAESVLRSMVSELQMGWHFFENDERTCEENIKRRNRDSREADLGKLHEYSRVYSIPRGAEVHPVTGSTL
jgi:hypothetical protein